MIMPFEFNGVEYFITDIVSEIPESDYVIPCGSLEDYGMFISTSEHWYYEHTIAFFVPNALVNDFDRMILAFNHHGTICSVRKSAAYATYKERYDCSEMTLDDFDSFGCPYVPLPLLKQRHPFPSLVIGEPVDGVLYIEIGD